MIAHIFIIFREGKRMNYEDFSALKQNLSDKNKELIKEDKVLHADFGGTFIGVHCEIGNIMGLTQNVVEELTEKGYTPNILSRDFPSGRDETEDWAFLERSINFTLTFLQDRRKEILTNGCECSIMSGVFTRGLRDKKCDKSEEEHFFIKRDYDSV